MIAAQMDSEMTREQLEAAGKELFQKANIDRTLRALFGPLSTRHRYLITASFLLSTYTNDVLLGREPFTPRTVVVRCIRRVRGPVVRSHMRDVLRAVDENDRRRLEAAANGVFYDLAFAHFPGVANEFYNHVILGTEP